MDNHPIPQDVTGFQFKLIGNMTVKQFAYLASGCVIAVLLFYFPVFVLIKIILVPLFAGAGAALAFLPIEGRPLDLMASNFVKDLFSPTQYIYSKVGGQLAISAISYQPVVAPTTKKEKSKHDQEQYEREIKLNQFLSHMTKQAKTKLDEKEDLLLAAVFNPTLKPQLLSELEERTLREHQLSNEEAMRVKMVQSPEDAEHALEREMAAIKDELAQAVQEEQQMEKTHQETGQVHVHVNDLEKELEGVMAQKQQLEQELLKLKEQSTALKPPEASVPQPAAAKSSENIRIIPSDKASSVGLPAIPDVPNIILGIVKDARGNVQPNILVEIKDKGGNPVRAFKTNGLGQFASATQLANGTYTVEFEDPKGNQQFERVEIEPHGEIMLPLEIISHDAREQLRKELFA